MPAPEVTPVTDKAFAALDRLTARVRGPLGIALSGGSDSTALVLLAAAWSGGADLQTVTVDHRLRPESAAEAKAAGAFAARLGLPHKTLIWAKGPDARTASGNLSALARDARRQLISDWARANRLGAVLLGHTLDDQAETVLLRLMRGSGADGLAGMAEASTLGGMLWLRPLLGIRREPLREMLRAEGIGWSDDPSNDDPAYDRIKVRKVIAELDLAPERLAESAAHLTRQRRVLEQDRDRLAQVAVQVGTAGEMVIDFAAFETAQEDTRLAVLADALKWVGGQVYRPRLRSLRDLWHQPDGRSLSGCLTLRRRGSLVICREPAAAEPATPANGRTLWDHRWQVTAPVSPDVRIGALGERGLDLLRTQSWLSATAPAGWRNAPRAARATTPAIWLRNDLLAAPIAGFLGEANGLPGPISAALAPLPARFGRCIRL